MRRILLIAVLLYGASLFAQSVTVTGTVSDSTGATYANAAITCTLVNPSGQAATINGSPVTTPVTSTSGSGGAVSMILTSNELIQPTGTSWRCTAVAQGNAPQISVNFTAHGAASTVPFAGKMPPLSSLLYVPNNGALSGACTWSQLGTDYTTSGSLYNCHYTPPALTGTWASISGGGGGGITSINGDTTAAQVIAAGTGISIAQGPAGTTTITNTGASSAAFSAITSGTNTTAAMLVGTGASLGVTGSGTIAATSLSALTGMPTQATNTVVMNATGSTAAPTAVAMPTCTTGADLYNTTTHTWSCVSTGGSANRNINIPLGLAQGVGTSCAGSSTTAITCILLAGSSTVPQRGLPEFTVAGAIGTGTNITYETILPSNYTTNGNITLNGSFYCSTTAVTGTVTWFGYWADVTPPGVNQPTFSASTSSGAVTVSGTQHNTVTFSVAFTSVTASPGDNWFTNIDLDADAAGNCVPILSSLYLSY